MNDLQYPNVWVLHANERQEGRLLGKPEWCKTCFYHKYLDVLSAAHFLHQRERFSFRNRDGAQDGAAGGIQHLSHRTDKRLAEQLHLSDLIDDKQPLASLPHLFHNQTQNFAARVTLSELITNSGSNSELKENVYIELCEPGEPDLNQVGFIRFCQLKTYSATLSLFIWLRATAHRTITLVV